MAYRLLYMGLSIVLLARVSVTYLDCDWNDGYLYCGYTSTNPEGWLVRQLAEDGYGEVAVSIDRSRTGEGSCMRSSLTHPASTNLANPRAEFHALNMNHCRGNFGSTKYYGFSIYLPAEFESDPNTEDILAQWHKLNSQQEPGNPNVILLVDGDQWVVRVSSDPNFLSTEDSWSQAEYIIGDTVLEQWTDFVVKIKWDYTANGRIQLYMKLADETVYQPVTADSTEYLRIGANCFNDPDPGYFKWGIYKPDWRNRSSAVDVRTVFHDNVRIGNTFDAVDPAKP